MASYRTWVEWKFPEHDHGALVQLTVSLLWSYLKGPSSLSVNIEHFLFIGHIQENVMSM